MVNRKYRRSFFYRHRLILSLLLALLLGTGAWALLKDNDQVAPATTGGNGSYINLNPPTEEEKKQSEARKDELSQSSTPAPTGQTSSGKKAVTPIITNADQNQINAYVPGIFEEGGTCKATLTKGTNTVTRTSTGFKNVSYTSCSPINVSGALSAGSWKLTVSYESSKAEGESAPKTIEVQ